MLFDLGKVLLDWDPRYYYAPFFGTDAAALDHFTNEVVGPEFYLQIDGGRSTAEVMAEWQRRFPRYASLIARWGAGWPDMLRGALTGTVEILFALEKRGLRLFALTNFSLENWPLAVARFDFLDCFEDIVISGEVGLVKPDPRIYALTIERCRLEPSRTFFIDDSLVNVEAGLRSGLVARQFTSAADLRQTLVICGVLER